MKASASQIIKWLKCPRAWAIRYIQKVYEPKSIHLSRGTFIHSWIENLHNLGLRDNKINKNNYETRLPEVAWELFETMIDAPTSNFGKPGPSFREQLIELYGDNPAEIASAIGETKAMLEVYLNKKLVELKVWTNKYDSFSKAWNTIKPKFKEFSINIEGFQGSLDEVYNIEDEVIISDLKSSTLTVGKDPNSDRYKQMGVSGLNQEYILQLFLYAWAYHKQTGIMPDWLSLNYIKHGHEVLIPFKYMDRERIVAEMEALVNEFHEATKSKNIDDYVCNACNNWREDARYKLDNTFCSAPGTKFAGRNFCFYDNICGAEGNIDEVTVYKNDGAPTHHGIYIDGDLTMLPCWLFDKKNLTISGSYVSNKDKKTEKALLISHETEGGSTWIPISQIKK